MSDLALPPTVPVGDRIGTFDFPPFYFASDAFSVLITTLRSRSAAGPAIDVASLQPVGGTSSSTPFKNASSRSNNQKNGYHGK